jgi:hypothetical protein
MRPDQGGIEMNKWHAAKGALVVGIAAALFLTVIWFVSPSSANGGSYDDVADYLFTGNGVPFAASAIVLLWALLAIHGERVGTRARVGVMIASVSLVAVIVVLAASVVAGHEVEGGPVYVLGTLGSIIGIALFCADAARAGLLPARALWFWAFTWTVGGLLGPKGSQVLLAAAYAVLLVRVRTTPQMMSPAVTAAEAMPNAREPMLRMSGTLSAVSTPPPRNGS